MTRNEEIYYIFFGIFIGILFVSPLPNILANPPTVTTKDWLQYSLSGLGIALIFYRIRRSSLEHIETLNANEDRHIESLNAQENRFIREKIIEHRDCLLKTLTNFKICMDAIDDKNYDNLIQDFIHDDDVFKLGSISPLMVTQLICLGGAFYKLKNTETSEDKYEIKALGMAIEFHNNIQAMIYENRPWPEYPNWKYE